ncbi:MAG: hypothetical protein HPY50_16095 [Firmicutes bacterium]|nr:hypothetical protein [Bacillota bacterium]
MFKDKNYRIGRWADYLASPHNRKPPAGMGRAACRMDRFWKRVLLFLIVLIFWLGLGLGPGWSIVASFFVMGLLNRYPVAPRSVRILTRGKKVWQAVRGQPEAAAFNHRCAALTGVGVLLMALSAALAGPWAWYYAALGVVNLFSSIVVLWLRGRALAETGKN